MKVMGRNEVSTFNEVASLLEEKPPYYCCVAARDESALALLLVLVTEITISVGDTASLQRS